MEKQEMFDENRAVEPYYLLLHIGDRPKQFHKEYQEFIRATEKLKNRKISYVCKKEVKDRLEDCLLCLKKQKEEAKAFDAEKEIEEFKNGKRYIEPKIYRQTKQATVNSVRELRQLLKKYYNPKELNLLAHEIRLPQNAIASLFVYLITGDQRISLTDKVRLVDFDNNNPKFLFSSNASRDDFDLYLKEIKKDRLEFEKMKKSFPDLKSIKDLTPFIYTDRDGLQYIAVNVYKKSLTKIRQNWDLIDKLQSQFSGYHFKNEIKSKNFYRDYGYYKGKQLPTENEAVMKANERFRKSVQ